MHSRSDRAACTIIAKNYIAHARVLARSFRQHNPDAEMFVLVVDDIDGRIDGAGEPFTLIRLDDVPLDDPASICFKYSILELCTAVKPFLMQHLFDRGGIQRLLYLDPDILVLDSLAPLYEQAGNHSILLTPHITDPIDDDALPNELTLLRCGVYNLGFLGIADTPTTRRMLAWWQKRCAEFCIVRLEDGLFVDQKWMDLVPGLFNDVAVVADAGYNVAYWNLHGRKITAEGSAWRVNGEPLRFFHFSGYDPDHPEVVSKHQTRHMVGQLGDAEALFAQYRALLHAEGADEVRHWPYAYSRFDNGVPVSPIIRDLFYRLGPERRKFGNPFATGHGGSFFHWLNAPAAGEPARPPYISNLVAHIMNYRRDLKEGFPDFRGRQRREFLQWVCSVGRWQLDLDARLLAPLMGTHELLPGHTAPSVRELAHAFATGSCRLCPGIALFERYGYGGWIRSFLLGMLQPRRAAPGASATAAPTAAAEEGGAAAVAPVRQVDGSRSLLARVARRAIERTLRPCGRHHLFANLVMAGTATLPGLSDIGPASMSESPPPFGLNLVGYLTTESGVGEAARLMAAAIKATDVPHALVNFEVSYNLRRSDRTFSHFSPVNPYAINLIHVNADQLPVFARVRGEHFFSGRYNIGFWMWELAEFPSAWQDRFSWVDEIWTPSTFTTQALARTSPVPVATVPLPVPPHADPGYGRSHFGLPPEAFVFLFVFDVASVFERKNPLAVVEAFTRAFGASSDVVLVLKYANADADPENAARLRQAAQDPRIRLLEGYLSRDEVKGLIAACDAYVSLHRSEGFGLTLAEAMSAGRVTIATGYSGNMEFMNSTNSFLVRHRLVETVRDHGPYRKGTVWADPDVDHAAEIMRWVVEHRVEAGAVAAKGRESVASVLGVDVIGRAVQARVEHAWKRGRACS